MNKEIKGRFHNEVLLGRDGMNTALVNGASALVGNAYGVLNKPLNSQPRAQPRARLIDLKYCRRINVHSRQCKSESQSNVDTGFNRIRTTSTKVVIHTDHVTTHSHC